MFIQDSRRSYRTYTYSTDTRVLVGTTDTRVLVGTTGLNRTYSDAGVPVGTTELIQMQENP